MTGMVLGHDIQGCTCIRQFLWIRDCEGTLVLIGKQGQWVKGPEQTSANEYSLGRDVRQ